MSASRRAARATCAPLRRDRAGMARRLLGPSGLARPLRQPQRPPTASRPTRVNWAVTCSRRRSWWTAQTVVVGSDRAAVEAAIGSAGGLPVRYHTQPPGRRHHRGDCGHHWPASSRAHRLRPAAEDGYRRRRERWPATTRVPRRAGSGDAGRMGRHRPPTRRQVAWPRARTGDSGAVREPSGSRRCRSAARLIRAALRGRRWPNRAVSATRRSPARTPAGPVIQTTGANCAWFLPERRGRSVSVMCCLAIAILPAHRNL